MQWCNSCNAASSIESQWLSKSCFWHQGLLTLNPLCNFNGWILPRITLWNNLCSSSKQYQHHGQGEAISHNSRIAYLLKKRICVIIYNWITNKTHSTATVLTNDVNHEIKNVFFLVPSTFIQLDCFGRNQKKKSPFMHTWKLDQLSDLNYWIKESLLSCLMIWLV